MSAPGITVSLTPCNIALLFIFGSACCHYLSQYLYFYYRLTFGTLYPSYSSFKAIKNRDTREYARWMMYWICFAMFTAAEVVTDIIFIWLPFYYEIKILFILWLMSPYGNGARIMYKNLIHPQLDQKENVIDSYIETGKEMSVSFAMQLLRKLSDTANSSLNHLFYYTQIALVQQLQSRTEAFTTPFFAVHLAPQVATKFNNRENVPSVVEIQDGSPEGMQVDQNNVHNKDMELLPPSFSNDSFHELTEIQPPDIDFSKIVNNNTNSSTVAGNGDETKKQRRKRGEKYVASDGLAQGEAKPRSRRRAALKAEERFAELD